MDKIYIGFIVLIGTILIMLNGTQSVLTANNHVTATQVITPNVTIMVNTTSIVDPTATPTAIATVEPQAVASTASPTVQPVNTGLQTMPGPTGSIHPNEVPPSPPADPDNACHFPPTPIPGIDNGSMP